MSHRNLEYLHRNNIIYRRYPVLDKPDQVFNWGEFYQDGTYECYELFRSKAKITTYKSLKWHLLVLWYLNDLNDEDFSELALFICDKHNNFVTFNIPPYLLDRVINEVIKLDITNAPKNKLRKVIFKDGCGLSIPEKLRIVGGLIGRTKKVNKDLMIWCLPFYVKNSNEAKKWFLWGYKNGITIFSWPDLNIDNVKKNTKCFKRWKRLICLPLDIPNNFLKKICN